MFRDGITYRSDLEAARDRYALARSERDESPADWADRHLLLPRGDGPIRHQSSLTPYWRHWHRLAKARLSGTPDAHDPAAHGCTRALLVCASQVGKTMGFVVPILAWIAATRPRDLGVVLPSHDVAKTWARDRLAQVFALSPRLEDLLPKGQAAREKRTGTKAWHLDRMILYFLNGAVALDLRSKDLPLILLDEFDALPGNVQGQGAPLALADERQKTFPLDRLMLGVTTPTLVDALGWSELCAGTHERLLFACPSCGAHHWPDPDQIEATDRAATSTAIRSGDLAVWRCRHCPAALTTDQLHAAIRAACAVPGWTPAGGWVSGSWEQRLDGSGHWSPAALVDDAGRITTVEPPKSIHRTGWLNALYSPFISLGNFLAHRREADAGSDELRQVHWNNWRAEPHHVRAAVVASAEVHRISVAPSAHYQIGQLQKTVSALLLTLDQQGVLWDRSWFPWVLRGWDQSGESWLIEAGQVQGPDKLDRLLARTWMIGGKARGIDLMSMDSANGNLTRQVREWVAKDQHHRRSISGSGTMAPDAALAEISRNDHNRDRLRGLSRIWSFNANIWKDDLYDHIRGAPGKPAWHLPGDVPDWYQDSLSSEERVLREVTIRGRRERRPIWVKRTITTPNGELLTREDNHWFDCEVMQLVLVEICHIRRSKPVNQEMGKNGEFSEAVW